RAGAALDALFVARPAWETAVAPALARPASILRAFRAGLSGAASPGPGAWLGPVTGRAPR
ncbi:MAG: hypothetical protein K2X11_09510, partial [Acetobacteraceae bacterium]|nr:hypothetical protein [Acetobacteraceae bacterium]